MSLIANNWMDSVKVGALLRPIPLWNQSERDQNRLPSIVSVEGVKVAACQSGIMFKVKNNGGKHVWLDAAWFTPS